MAEDYGAVLRSEKLKAWTTSHVELGPTREPWGLAIFCVADAEQANSAADGRPLWSWGRAELSSSAAGDLVVGAGIVEAAGSRDHLTSGPSCL
jgi:hypothetical protein